MMHARTPAWRAGLAFGHLHIGATLAGMQKQQITIINSIDI